MGLRLIWLNLCVLVYSTMFWLYGIAYQLAFPIGITEGHPIAHWDILNNIRVDDFAMCSCIVSVLSFISLGFMMISFCRQIERERLEESTRYDENYGWGL